MPLRFPGVSVLLVLLSGGGGLSAEPAQAPNREGTPTRVVRPFSNQEAERASRPDHFLFSPEVVSDPADGSIRLAHSVLVADEMGATDWRQTEPLSSRVWAKKVFVLDSVEVAGAELFLFGSAHSLRVNGTPVAGSSPLVSTGWTRVKIEPALLKKGANEVVFSHGGSLLLEPSRQPARSFKSTDGGKTWSNRTLGSKHNQRGEYLVRLRLGRYAPHGWARLAVLDLWTAQASAIATPGRLITVHGLTGLPRVQAQGTTLTAWMRTGSTPAPETKTWTDWFPLVRPHRPAGTARHHRWAQLRFDLATSRAQSTPRLPARFHLVFDLVPDATVSKDKLEIVPPAARDRPAPLALGSVPFVYQAPSPRLQLLRERYQLDRAIAGGKTEMEQLMLLRHWVRNQWHSAWGTHPASWMPPWDALVILSSRDQADCLTMCTHYAAVFTQCCLALGWTARHCILDHHCTAEVWVNQHRKWVMMDAGNSAERPDCNLHFERNGVPLSALELHLVQRSKQTQGITVHFTPARLMAQLAPLCRPAPPSKVKLPPRPDVVALADLGKYPVCGLNNYRRYAFPARNNYLDSLYPGELYQGWSEYFHDGYCWVGDSPDGPTLSPEYSSHLVPSRAADIDWSLNWSRIHLARTAKPGELEVKLETGTPNLARLEMTTRPGPVAARDWKVVSPRLVWKLKPGLNLLRVHSVNQFGRPGAETQVQVRWASAAR